jgi:hypothetical protein
MAYSSASALGGQHQPEYQLGPTLSRLHPWLSSRGHRARNRNSPWTNQDAFGAKVGVPDEAHHVLKRCELDACPSHWLDHMRERLRRGMLSDSGPKISASLADEHLLDRAAKSLRIAIIYAALWIDRNASRRGRPRVIFVKMANTLSVSNRLHKTDCPSLP